MAGSSFGSLLRVTTFGESHGEGVGAVLDGMPAGMELKEEDIQVYLDRRKPGRTSIATNRKESDLVKILSGVFQGKTEGTPIALWIRNENQNSRDYEELANCYRPGHADYTYDQKYGFRDYRGGGRSSARETAARVAAGAIAEKFLKELGIRFCFYTAAIGDIVIDPSRFDVSLISTTPTCMPDQEANAEAVERIEECRRLKDSIGGVVKGKISGVPAGIGDPTMNRLDARLADALMGINACKSVGIGDGMFAAYARGSENNDAFYTDENGMIRKRTNHAGGILGGISDGSDIVVTASFKPTPSIEQPQETVMRDKTPKALTIHGRHDPCVVPRAVVVCETMCAITLLDAMLVNMSAKAEKVKQFYLGDLSSAKDDLSQEEEDMDEDGSINDV